MNSTILLLGWTLHVSCASKLVCIRAPNEISYIAQFISLLGAWVHIFFQLFWYNFDVYCFFQILWCKDWKSVGWVSGMPPPLSSGQNINKLSGLDVYTWWILRISQNNYFHPIDILYLEFVHCRNVTSPQWQSKMFMIQDLCGTAINVPRVSRKWLVKDSTL